MPVFQRNGNVRGVGAGTIRAADSFVIAISMTLLQTLIGIAVGIWAFFAFGGHGDPNDDEIDQHDQGQPFSFW